MRRLVVSGSFPFTTHTFVIREVASAYDEGDDVHVLSPDDGDTMGEELRRKLGFPRDRAIYLDYAKCSPFSLDPNRLRRDVSRAGMRELYGWLLAARRKTFFCRLIRDSRLRNLDLIHSHFASWAFRVAAPLADILQLPLTIAAHEAELFSRLGRPMLAYLQDRAEVITLDSAGALREWANVSGSDRRLRLVHQGVELGEFESIVRNDDGIDPRAPVRLISVARLTSHKRIGDAVRALRELINEGLPVRYSIVSDGPERGSLESMCAELGLRQHVDFLGFVSRNRLVAELASADIFVHPSEAEGFGVAVVEAMASGLPVVVARSIGVQDIINHEGDGYMYPPGDVAQLVDRIRSLARDSRLRIAMGRRGRETAFEKFSWNSHMSKMKQVWLDAQHSFEARQK